MSTRKALLQFDHDDLVVMYTADGREIAMKITKILNDLPAIDILPRCRYKIPVQPCTFTATWLPLHFLEHGFHTYPIVDEDQCCRFVCVANNSDKVTRLPIGTPMFREFALGTSTA
jgi:hypothetical protein